MFQAHSKSSVVGRVRGGGRQGRLVTEAGGGGGGKEGGGKG